MYNTFLHRYLVIELKDTEFIPEYIGKLNFYCSAVDDILCREGDNRTIGLLLCKSKDRIKAEYALRDIQKPIGISDYELGQALPKDFRGSLPTIEEIEKELESDNQWTIWDILSTTNNRYETNNRNRPHWYSNNDQVNGTFYFLLL